MLFGWTRLALAAALVLLTSIEQENDHDSDHRSGGLTTLAIGLAWTRLWRSACPHAPELVFVLRQRDRTPHGMSEIPSRK